MSEFATTTHKLSPTIDWRDIPVSGRHKLCRRSPSGDIRGGAAHITVLRTLAQVVVEQNDREHGLGDRGGPKADAGIVAAGRDDFHRLAGGIDGPARYLDARGRLQGEMGDHILAGRDSPEDPAGVVAGEPLGRELVAMLAAALRDRTGARADLHRLDGIDSHERAGDIGIEAIEDRLAEAGRYARRNHGHPGAERIAFRAQLPDEHLELRDPRRIGTEERVLVGECRIARFQSQGAHLAQVAVDPDAEPRCQVFAGDRPGRDPHHRLAGRRSPAAAVVAQAVFLLIGVVRVPGPEAVLDLLVIARTRVGILDQEADRRAGGLSVEDTREDADLVAFTALADELRSARAASVDILLDVLLRQRKSRWAAV